MSRKGRHSRLWEYLESSGILERGSDEEIKAIKREYRRKYVLEYRRKERASKPEITVRLSKTNGEYETVMEAAKKHNQKTAAFIQKATLAYIRQTYIVPDKLQVARLEQLLLNCLNEIKSIIKPRERFFWEKDRKLETIERRIEKLEGEINEVLRNPPLISHDRQNQIA